MQWWCSAVTAPWTWGWRPYPGVWLFVALLAAGYVVLRRRLTVSSGRDQPPAGRATARPGLGRGHPAWFAAGLVLVWAALDWPIGPLGASYLASVHMVQVLLLSLLAPALLLMGVPPSAFRALEAATDRRPAARRILSAATHPVVALLLYNGVIVATHVPRVLDALSATQAGMAAMDLAWLSAGLLFWWPVLSPVPRRAWFGWFFKMGYLFLNTLPVTVPYSFLVFADVPLYATYELAPPIPGVSSLTDQRVAGLAMKFGGGAVLWTAITLLFFRWWRVEQQDEPTAAGPPAPGQRPGTFREPAR